VHIGSTLPRPIPVWAVLPSWVTLTSRTEERDSSSALLENVRADAGTSTHAKAKDDGPSGVPTLRGGHVGSGSTNSKKTTYDPSNKRALWTVN
jgi:hypothetical protein